MNVDHQARGAGHWPVPAIFCALLVLLTAFIAMRSRSTRSALLEIDSKGTTRLGPLPLRNTNLRDAVFTAVAHLNSGTVSVSVAESATMNDFNKTALAMRRAGMTSITVRWDGSPFSNRDTGTNK